jgi:hypothetical protein
MHPLRKLRESGKPTAAQVSELLAENIVFNSPILVRPIEGREVVAAIFAQSSATRGSGTYTAEFKLDERTTFLRWVGSIPSREYRKQHFESIWRSIAQEEILYRFCTKTLLFDAFDDFSDFFRITAL